MRQTEGSANVPKHASRHYAICVACTEICAVEERGLEMLDASTSEGECTINSDGTAKARLKIQS